MRGTGWKQSDSDKKYSVGIYARLSVDNHDGKEGSIDSQIAMAREYMENHSEMILYDCYSDLGVSGTNFDRCEFDRLMQDIRNGCVNCVIVKDLSRFGRNYIETGDYIEKIFPFLGVRFIALTDDFDSIRPMDENQRLSVNLKNIANELYAKDIAEKVTASKMVKMLQGEFIGSNAPYGYRVRRAEGKRMLFPEREAGLIVKKIFEMYDAGETLASIAVWLYENKVHRPKDCRKYKTVYRREGQSLAQWSRGSLKAVLKNTSYLGSLTQMSKGADGPITVEHTHEPLLEAELYHRVRLRMEKNAQAPKHGSLNEKTQEDVFRGLLYCGECGHKLVKIASVKGKSHQKGDVFPVYGCPNKKRIDEDKCAAQSITFLSLSKILSEVLKKEIAFCTDQRRALAEFSAEQTKRRRLRLQQKAREIQKRADHSRLQASSCYMEYRRGKISQEMFRVKRKELEEQSLREKEKLTEVKRELDFMEQKMEAQSFYDWFFVKGREEGRVDEKRMNESGMDAELVRSLVKRINIYSGKRIEIIWNFSVSDIYGETDNGK